MTMRSLMSAGVPRSDERLQCSAEWCRAQQCLGCPMDMNFYCPKVSTGGIAFEYDNPWYPDIDDTAAIVLALLEQTGYVFDNTVVRAAEWIFSMQNRDGGFAAFDCNRTSFLLHKHPFDDMDNLCDPSYADITGRTLELCGVIICHANSAQAHPSPPLYLVEQAHRAAHRAIAFMAAQ